MLNRAAAILLILFTLSANFSQLFIFAGYNINQKYIATTLCENRGKPWLHCNGKCYLAKKIKQAEDKEKNEERQTGKSLFQEAFFPTSVAFNFPVKLIGVLHTPYPSFSLPQSSSTIFQPPQA